MSTARDEDYPRSIVDVEDLKSRLNSLSDPVATGSPSQQRHFAKQGGAQSAKPGDAWLLRQQLQDACHDLIVSNNGSCAELAVNKRIEQDLWNYAFRQQIALLESQYEQQQSGSVSPIHLAATRTSLQYFLELATGFYLQLMEEVSLIAALDVYPLCRDRDHFGALSPVSISSSSSPVGSLIPRSIATYLVQHCLVHLGDLARYMAKLAPSGESAASEAAVDHLEIAQHYYVAAAMLVPFSGQPFNQLAIVEAQQGNRLGAAYLYARALSARSPFPAAEQNLTRLLERILASSPLVKDKQQQQQQQAPKSIAELVTVCIQLLATAWLKPTQSSNFVATTLLSHLGSAAQSFLSDRVGSTFSWFQLVQLAFLNAFIVSRRHHTQQSKTAFSFTVLFLNHLVRELIATAKSDNGGGVNFGRSPLLPATRLLLSFLAANANVLLNSPDLLKNTDSGGDECSITDIRSPRLWHSIAKLADVASLAGIKSSLPYSCPLPEDVELRGCNIFNDNFAPSPLSKSSDGGLSPQERANSADAHIDFESGTYPSYTSSSSPSSTAASTSGSAIAFLACARFSETCVHLAASAPSFLVVLSSDPCPRFACPIPIPVQLQQPQSQQSSVSAIIMSNVPISKSQGSSVVSSQSYMIKSSNNNNTEFPNSEVATSKQPALLPTPFSHSSSSSSIGAVASTTGTSTAAPTSSGDRPRNVVFQSIVHTMRARGGQPSSSGANSQTATPSTNGNNSNPSSLSNSNSNLNNLTGSPRLTNTQRFNSQNQQPNSGSGSNTPRNFGTPNNNGGNNNSNSNNNNSNNNAEDSDSATRQASMHRNLPPRLARLAEAEANSRGSNSNNAHNSPRGMPLHINLSSSTSSSSSSVSSGRQPTSAIQQAISSYRQQQQQQQQQLFNQREQVPSDLFSEFSGDGRNVRGGAAFQKPGGGFGGLPEDSKNSYKLGNNAALDGSGNNNNGAVDDGWPVLACLRPQLTNTDPVSHIRSIHSEPMLPPTKGRLPITASVPTTLNEMSKQEQTTMTNTNSSSCSRIQSQSDIPSPSSNTTVASDRATAFSLFGLHTFDSDKNWPWSLSAASSSSLATPTNPPATTTTTTTTEQPSSSSSNSGWSPMLSSSVSSAFTQPNKPQQQQIQSESSSLLFHSLATAAPATAGASALRQQQPAATGKDNGQSASSLFGCHSSTKNTSSSSSAVGDTGNLVDFGWSQLQPNGISPSRLWSAFGFDLHKNQQVGESAVGHAPPTPPN